LDTHGIKASMKYIYQLTYLLFALEAVGRLFWKDFFFSNTNLLLFFVLAASALISYCLFHSIFKQRNSSESARKQRVHTGFLTFIFVYSLTAPAIVALVFSSTLTKFEEISLSDDLTLNELGCPNFVDHVNLIGYFLINYKYNSVSFVQSFFGCSV
jgi:hypothetical protein